MKIKATLKKLKRGDVISIDWIDAGDLDDSPSSWFSEADAEKVFKEIPVETIEVYFGNGKENLFWSEIPKNRIFPIHIIVVPV